MNAGKWMLVSLLTLNFASAIGVVYNKHLSRNLFVESRKLQATIDALDIDWGRLQLEQSTWGTHGRVEKLASNKLDMFVPDFDQRVMVPR